jgi:K+-sensing histidine kinase KdpD
MNDWKEDELIAFTHHEIEAATENLKETLKLVSIAISTPKIDRQNLEHRIEKCIECAYSIEIASNLFAVTAPEEYKKKSRVDKLNVYRVTDKVVRLMAFRSKKLKKRLNLSGTSDRYISTYPCLEVIFFVLIDNALKYSFSGQPIDINVIEGTDDVVWTISSWGPHVELDEVDRISSFGERGAHAIDSGIHGSGIGLYVAKALCQLLEYSFEVIPSAEKAEVNGIPYSTFLVRIGMS